MNQRTFPDIEEEALERELREQLEKIQNEDVPEQLLELARELQSHLRQRLKSEQ